MTRCWYRRALAGGLTCIATLACAFPKMEVVSDQVKSDANHAGAASGNAAAGSGPAVEASGQGGNSSTSGDSTASVSGQGGTPTTRGDSSAIVLGLAGNATNASLPSSGGTLAVASSSGVVTGVGCSGELETWLSDRGHCVAKTVTIGSPNATSSYGIDATEVTRGQYEAWLASNPAAALKSDVSCGTNSSYTPNSTCMASSHVCKSSCNDHPVVCVDWCDAQAYCTAIGKRLCGKIGGGANSFADQANADQSQWYRACSAAASNTYPYGNVYGAANCNGNEYWTSTTSNTTLPVATIPACQSSSAGYAGIFDLSGNVMEWEDSCASTGETASCRLRGGSFDDNSNTLGCSYAFSYARNTTHLRIGFRCCT